MTKLGRDGEGRRDGNELLKGIVSIANVGEAYLVKKRSARSRTTWRRAHLAVSRRDDEPFKAIPSLLLESDEVVDRNVDCVT